MDIEEKLLKLIKSKKKGILQNELWKKAKIDSSKCSRILARLEKEGKISREPSDRTFIIKYLQEKKEKIKNFKLLLIDDMFSPCTGCALECIPEQCIRLSEWVCRLEQ
ncbi:MAG: MarR family transcriptional regulator [Candidatus Methanoperedens sp.]|nr:MarR family transcriptional regulator [Candidatus Methanoperedens sp.]MCZ7395184.1 MarR family transcriptional regulator [Candidatus Methanoperedens sp.]